MIDCTQFDPMHCTLTWALNSLKIIIPFLLGMWLGYKLKDAETRKSEHE